MAMELRRYDERAGAFAVPIPQPSRERRKRHSGRFSTNIPTHNIGEIIDGAVAVIDNPKIKLDELMKIVPGPDFSTGGIIIAGDDLVQAYSTGKGKITLRARIHIEDGEYEKKNIVISELPYQVEKADLLQKILQLREAKKTYSAVFRTLWTSPTETVCAP